MTKEDLIKRINEIVEFITNGKVERDGRVFEGHPDFYILHSKEEFDNKLNNIITNKESYDRYDLYYYTMYMFKYMLNQYDSHTKLRFVDIKLLPMKLRLFDDSLYIVDACPRMESYIGAKILAVNGVDFRTVYNELESIICYASNEYLKISIEDYFSNCNTLMSLPSLNRPEYLILNTDKGNIHIDVNNLDIYEDKSIKPNYNLEVVDNTAVITYNAVHDLDGMLNLIEELKQLDNIANYVVDLRGNYGGRSSINNPLIEYLKDKKVKVLVDERTFSSARMCMVELKNNGAITIGTTPGTPVSCFGNCVMQKIYDDFDLKVNGSATFWHYDEDLNCQGYYKDEFISKYQEDPHFIDNVFLNVDEEVSLTLDDYLMHNDRVLNYALSSNTLKKA